ncbi:unnamed protein product [Adineta steineri]|uniref:G domain-containing protein n=1 Tax=Adineta steineri TaxID=433720 RepID=A0A813QMZ3_9BILA|nr:unnamed protein product [Adineta steineri]CAF3822043.1 unnamed protein product [Adineta steineri]
MSTAAVIAPACQLAITILNSLVKTREMRQQSQQLTQELESYREENAALRNKFEELQEHLTANKLTSYEDLIKHDKEKADTLVNLANDTKKLDMQGLNIGLFGQTSTGKSAMINSMLGEEVAETGYGETTTFAKPYESKMANYTLHDLPGKNDSVSYFTMEYIAFWKGLSSRVIVIEKTVKEMTTVIQLLDAIDLHYDLVVNKLDCVPEAERESFKQKIQSEIKECNLKNCDHVWFVSAINIQQFDWLQMVAALLPN